MPRTEEMTAALATAEAMAAQLITLPGVNAIHLSPLPDYLDGITNTAYRLMAVVDDATAENYRLRLASPLIITEMDGAGAQITGSGEVVDAVVFPSERHETQIELFFDLLNTSKDNVFPSSVWQDTEVTDKWWGVLQNMTVLDMLEEIELVLVHADWQQNVDLYAEITRVSTWEGDELDDVNEARQHPTTVFLYGSGYCWNYAADHYQVFDPSTGSFSSR